MYVKKSHLINKEEISAGNKTSRQVLIGDQEAPNFAMRLFTIEKDGSMPNHTNTIEHEQYVVNGKARIAINGEEYDVEKGDVVFIPAGIPHWYKNTGDDDFQFLCLIPNKEDKITLIV